MILFCQTKGWELTFWELLVSCIMLIFRIASGPKPKEETKERKSSIDGKDRKNSIDGKEKKEGKEKLTKAAANNVRTESTKHIFDHCK